MKAIWSGTIHFGLLYIPISVYPTVTERRPDFTLIRKKDHCPIANIRVCRETRVEVPYSQITRGYEYKQGKFVEVADKDFAKIDQEKTHAIQILNFTALAEIDPIYFEKPYLIDTSGQNHSFVLFKKALLEANKAAIVKFILTTQENLGVVFVHENKVYLNQIRYNSQIKSVKKKQPEEHIHPKELAAAVQLVEQLSVPFQPNTYKDTFYQHLKKLISAKVEGKILPTKERKPQPTPENEILPRLEQSLDYANRGIIFQA